MVVPSISGPFKMIKRLLLSFEDPDKPLLGPNVWILKKTGLLLPENRFGKYIYVILHELVTFFVVTQYMELYEIGSNLDLAITNLKISMLSTICLVKSNSCVYWQKYWLELVDYITEADKDERDDKDDKRTQILDSYTRYCRRITFFYWFMVFSTFVTTVTSPLLKYLTETYMEEESDILKEEEFYHIFSSWMPFDKYHRPGNWITVIWHVLTCVYGASIMAAYDTSVMVIMVFFGGKLDLLRERCKLMLGIGGRDLTETEAIEMFSKMHHTHVQLMKYSRMFNSLLSPVMFFYVIMCSLMLCASAFQLTSTTNATLKLLNAEYLIFGIAQLFMFCWHSNDVLFKSELLVLGPFESEWWHASVKQRRALHLLCGQMKKTVMFTAGPFTNLTLSTFISIMKGAYSYYTLLRK